MTEVVNEEFEENSASHLCDSIMCSPSISDENFSKTFPHGLPSDVTENPLLCFISNNPKQKF
jgi:hypothetical protein